jgi:hypothetical protein
VSEPNPSDQFESRYMSGDAPVRHRDKLVSRAMTALLGVPALFVLVLAVVIGLLNDTASKPVPAGALPFVLAGMVGLAGLFALMAVTFAVLRTTVTNREVVVRYGLWGPRIALDSITSCKVVDYEWTKFGGWGIRRGIGGVWAYVPASCPQVVEITYTDGGKEKRVQIGAGDPQSLAAQIQEARQLSPGVRISASGEKVDALAETTPDLGEAAAEARAELRRRG